MAPFPVDPRGEMTESVAGFVVRAGRPRSQEAVIP